MYFSLESGRIPLAAGTAVDLGPGQRFIIDSCAPPTNLSLTYLVHPEQEPEVRFLLKELYPHPRVREEEIIQRLEDGTIRIWNPFAGLWGPDDQTLQGRYRQHFEAEARLYPGADIPICAQNGNLYLLTGAVPTESLKTLLDRCAAVRTGPNPMLGYLLRLLEQTAALLKDLPCCHLELSPEQIFLVHDQPCLQDLGARFDPTAGTRWELELNPWSPPEDRQAANATWDTYALSAMLYQAAAGCHYDPEKPDWTGIRQRYASELCPGFSGHLIRFFQTGLSRQADCRFSSAAQLADALRALREEYELFRSLLPLIPRDELASYLLLDKHPLYPCRNDKGELHVLCLGSGRFGQRMILSLMSCGQIIGTSLHIHVISREDPEQLCASLLRTAPALEQLSNLVRDVEQPALSFHFQQVRDLLEPDTCRTVLRTHPDARYLVISLGSGETNARAAKLYTQALAAMALSGGAKTIVNYHCPENFIPALQLGSLPDWLEVDAFGDHLQSYAPVALRLAQLTIRLTHLHRKSAGLSLGDTAEQLTGDAYSQRSNCAAALHLRCKLAGLGIDPAAPVGKIAAAYQKALASETCSGLLENEHTRRRLFLAAEGYALPAGASDPAGKSHPCMAPFGEALDQMSGSLRRITGEKCRSILGNGEISGIFRAISQKLEAAIQAAEAQSGIREALHLSRLQLLRAQLAQTEDTVISRAQALRDPGCRDALTGLEAGFLALTLDISQEVLQLNQLLSVFEEYASGQDLRTELLAAVRHLPWVLFAGRKTTMLKLPGRSAADHIAAPLTLDPDRLIYIGIPEQPQWVRLLRSRGCQGEIRFTGRSEHGIDRSLRQTLEQLDSACIIDITGASDDAVAAAFRLCLENRRVALIRSSPEGALENLHHYPLASFYPLPAPLTAHEIQLLLNQEAGDLEEILPLAPALWQMYRCFHKKWDMISAFFSLPAALPAELEVSGIHPAQALQWPMQHYILAPDKWELTQLGPAMEALEEAGLIRGLQTVQEARYVQVSFACPQLPDDSFSARLRQLFTKILPKAIAPYRCRIQDQGAKGYAVSISSGCLVSLADNNPSFFHSGGVRFPYKDIRPVLDHMAQAGFISSLACSDPMFKPNRISFTYTHPAIRDCLLNPLPILRLYILNNSRQHFDDGRLGGNFGPDLILTRGKTAMMVCARTEPLNRDTLYEVRYLTDRFSPGTIPVVAYIPDRQESCPASIQSLADAMDIRLIDVMAADLSLGQTLAKLLPDR